MIILLFANRIPADDAGAIWFAAAIELLFEALVISLLVGGLVLGA